MSLDETTTSLLLLGIGSGVGFTISEIREYIKRKRNLKKIKFQVTFDAAKHYSRAVNNIGKCRTLEWDTEHENRIMTQILENDERVYYKFHENFDFSVWNKILSSSEFSKLDEEFVLSYSIAYQRIIEKAEKQKTDYEEFLKELRDRFLEYEEINGEEISQLIRIFEKYLENTLENQGIIRLALTKVPNFPEIEALRSKITIENIDNWNKESELYLNETGKRMKKLRKNSEEMEKRFAKEERENSDERIKRVVDKIKETEEQNKQLTELLKKQQRKYKN